MPTLNLPDGTVILDGGMGRELRFRNTFQPVPEDWTLDGDQETDGTLGLRSDLDPGRYAEHVAGWVEVGANVVGGCCGTRPAHIAKVRELLLGA